jgi:hypothetical protein
MTWRKSIVLTARACALTAPLAWAGCTDDSVTLTVECPIVPESDDVGCTYNPTGDCLLDGELNVATQGNYYHQVFRVSSALKPRESDIPVMGEVNNVRITEFEVTVLDTSGGKIDFQDERLPNPFRIATSGFIPVGGVGIAGGELLPAPYVTKIAANEAGQMPLGQVIAAVKVRGKTQGEVDVEAGEYRWPIRLYQFNVARGSTTCEIFDGAICNFGQDGFVNACIDQTVEE